MEGVKNKWASTNFRVENMIVVTSFLYAKDNDYLILDAVKKLADDNKVFMKISIRGSTS